MSTATGRTSEREGRVPTRRPGTGQFEHMEEGHPSVSSPQFPHGDSGDSDDANLHRPPTPRAPHVKITLWRLLNTLGLLVLSICKSILIFRGQTLAPDHLDWSIGIAWVFIRQRVLSLFEQEAPSIAPWLFEDDLTPQVRGGLGLVLKLALLWLGGSVLMSIAMAWFVFSSKLKINICSLHLASAMMMAVISPALFSGVVLVPMVVPPVLARCSTLLSVLNNLLSPRLSGFSCKRSDWMIDSVTMWICMPAGSILLFVPGLLLKPSYFLDWTSHGE
ncbi:hypothetical protein C8J57DRAFT_1465519 [Mycena rebaudengoi]|nr:hypothetical protein C8J57DRAFT_1465519 [Mycena rebaudengoi]